MRTFKDVPVMSRESLDKVFSTGTTHQICHALVSMAFHEKDWEWAEGKCLLFLEHPDVDVSGLAATCLGHIARIHGALNRGLVFRRLEEKAKSTPDIAGCIEDAIEDIRMFM